MCGEANNYSNIFCMVEIDCARGDYCCVHYSCICLSLKCKDVELGKLCWLLFGSQELWQQHVLSAGNLNKYLLGLHSELGL